MGILAKGQQNTNALGSKCQKDADCSVVHEKLKCVEHGKAHSSNKIGICGCESQYQWSDDTNECMPLLEEGECLAKFTILFNLWYFELLCGKNGMV